MTYALRRGRQWISAPQGHEQGQLLPPVLAICDTADQAWLANSLDLAIERQTLLRNCWGWATEVRAFR